MPVLLPRRLLWSQVLHLDQVSLDRMLAVPEQDEEESFLIWVDDLLITVMLATME